MRLAYSLELAHLSKQDRLYCRARDICRIEDSMAVQQYGACREIRTLSDEAYRAHRPRCHAYDDGSVLRAIEDNFGLDPIHKEAGDGTASFITSIWKFTAVPSSIQGRQPSLRLPRSSGPKLRLPFSPEDLSCSPWRSIAAVPLPLMRKTHQ